MTNNIKIIALDLDGTLLPQDRKITPHTAEVLHTLRAEGLKLVIATGRPWRAITEFLDVVPFDAVICHNGAFTRIAGQDFGARYIPQEILHPFIATLKTTFKEISMLIESEDIMYVNFDVQELWQEADARACDFSALDLPTADKIIIIFDELVKQEAVAALLPSSLYMDISSDGQIGYIMHQHARKDLALAEVAAHFGCTLADCIAFGDDINDLGLILNCAYGVAMANGIETIRENARYHTVSNEEEGVAVWLKRHFGLRQN